MTRTTINPSVRYRRAPRTQLATELYKWLARGGLVVINR